MNSISTTAKPQDLIHLTDQIDYLLIDCSSSMTDKWIESIGALDTYIKAMKHEHMNSRVILHMFYSQQVDYIHSDCPLSDYKSLIEEGVGPFGSTPLYDAVNVMGRKLNELNPERCSIVIVTDGDDTGSQTTPEQARGILDWARAKGWQVTFIGADFSNASMARMLGSNKNEAIGVQKKLLADAAKSLAKKRAAYGRAGAPMHWSEDEQQQFGGYLAGPGASK